MACPITNEHSTWYPSSWYSTVSGYSYSHVYENLVQPMAASSYPELVEGKTYEHPNPIFEGAKT
jgi:hypothetical protein